MKGKPLFLSRCPVPTRLPDIIETLFSNSSFFMRGGGGGGRGGGVGGWGWGGWGNHGLGTCMTLNLRLRICSLVKSIFSKYFLFLKIFICSSSDRLSMIVHDWHGCVCKEHFYIAINPQMLSVRLLIMDSDLMCRFVGCSP